MLLIRSGDVMVMAMLIVVVIIVIITGDSIGSIIE